MTNFHNVLPWWVRKLTALSILLVIGCADSGSKPEALAVTEMTIDELRDTLIAGRATCRQIIQAHLTRINAYDDSSGLNAITLLNPLALIRADDLDKKKSAGDSLGDLFCVPVLVKDNFDTHDLLTTGGSIAMKDHVPPDDAFMVRKLREADAVVVAKTNMAEWAFSPRRTESSSFGITANAYALDRVPAGSSGGTASGIAASYAIVGLGSDTGNSIRGPSSHLALFGIRSTIGLTSRDGVIPLAFDRDIAGPMTRTVRDGAIAFNVLAGFDEADELTRLGRGKRSADYTVFLDASGLHGLRIGVLRALAEEEEADERVITLFEEALADLTTGGAEIVDPLVIRNFSEHLDGDYFCPRFRYDMYRYFTAEGDAAPFTDVMTVRDSGAHSDYVKGNLEFFSNYPLDVAPDDWETPCPTFPAHQGRQRFLDDVVAAMDEARVDVLVYPTWNNIPASLDKPREEYKGDNSQRVAPATGMPAATVPMGFVEGNLPTGLQILARPFAEPVIFKVAYAYEQATKHRTPPGRFPELEQAQ